METTKKVITFMDYLKLQEVVKPFLAMKRLTPVQLAGQIAYAIDEYMEPEEKLNGKLGRVFHGFVWNEYRDNWRGFIPEQGSYKHTLISTFNDELFMVRGYPTAVGELSTYDFNERVPYIFPKYDGVLLSTYIMPNDVFWGKTKEIEYIDRNGGMNFNFLKGLRDLGIQEKLEQLSRDYHCVVHGIIRGPELSGRAIDQYEYIALDISDRYNHSFYTKDISSKIFKEYGIPQEQQVTNMEETMLTHGGVVGKLYANGNLILVKEEMEEEEEIRLKRVVRDAYAFACDFCWTNPSYTNRMNKALAEHCIIDVTVDEMRDYVYHPSINAEREAKVKGYLDTHYVKIKDMDPWQIFESLRWKWEWSALNERDVVLPIIRAWKEELKTRNLNELEELNRAGHSDAIYLD